eukprot:jgi/Botrbrau1/8183/Bobra.357_2s0027.2
MTRPAPPADFAAEGSRTINLPSTKQLFADFPLKPRPSVPERCASNIPSSRTSMSGMDILLGHFPQRCHVTKMDLPFQSDSSAAASPLSVDTKAGERCSRPSTPLLLEFLPRPLSSKGAQRSFRVAGAFSDNNPMLERTNGRREKEAMPSYTGSSSSPFTGPSIQRSQAGDCFEPTQLADLGQRPAALASSLLDAPRMLPMLDIRPPPAIGHHLRKTPLLPHASPPRKLGCSSMVSPSDVLHWCQIAFPTSKPSRLKLAPSVSGGTACSQGSSSQRNVCTMRSSRSSVDPNGCRDPSGTNVQGTSSASAERTTVHATGGADVQRTACTVTKHGTQGQSLPGPATRPGPDANCTQLDDGTLRLPETQTGDPFCGFLEDVGIKRGSAFWQKAVPEALPESGRQLVGRGNPWGMGGPTKNKGEDVELKTHNTAALRRKQSMFRQAGEDGGGCASTVKKHGKEKKLPLQRRPQVPRAERQCEEDRLRRVELKKQEAEQRRAEEHSRHIDSIFQDGPLLGWQLPSHFSGGPLDWPNERLELSRRQSRRGNQSTSSPLVATYLPLARRRQKCRLHACNYE